MLIQKPNTPRHKHAPFFDPVKAETREETISKSNLSTTVNSFELPSAIDNISHGPPEYAFKIKSRSKNLFKVKTDYRKIRLAQHQYYIRQLYPLAYQEHERLKKQEIIKAAIANAWWKCSERTFRMVYGHKQPLRIETPRKMQHRRYQPQFLDDDSDEEVEVTQDPYTSAISYAENLGFQSYQESQNSEVTYANESQLMNKMPLGFARSFQVLLYPPRGDQSTFSFVDGLPKQLATLCL